MTAELDIFQSAFLKLVEGRRFEGEAAQLASEIEKQLERAEKIIASGKALDQSSRKRLIADIEKLSAAFSRKSWEPR
jgi:hypothetical protein